MKKGIILLILIVLALTVIPAYGSRMLVVSETPEIKVETNCTDEIDNDCDGLIDNDDGDCWIREGAVFMENYYMTTFEDYLDILPELKEIGIKTIEMMPIWDHCTSRNTAQRWAVRDFSKLDPMRGNENDLRTFIDTAHDNNIKVLTMMVETGSAVPPYEDCGGYYDGDHIGGALYQYQIKNPDKNILVRDKDGEFVCGIGAQYAVNWSSGEVIDFFKNIYKQIQDYGFDGQRLDAPCEMTCKKEEIIYAWMCDFGVGCSDCDGKLCPYPVDTQYSPMTYFRELAKIKKPSEVFISECPSVKTAKSNWFCSYPYYPQDTMVDEIAEASESCSLPYILPDVCNSNLSSVALVDWIKNEPISYDRQRFRFISTWTRTTKPITNFIVNDPRYFPAITLISTMTGIPKMTHYELFGDRRVDKFRQIQGDSVATAPKRRAHWKNILNTRNNNNTLKYGNIENIWKSGDNTYAYSRTYKGENVAIIINFNGEQATSTLDAPFKTGDILKDELSGETFTVTDPTNFKISVPAYGSRILTNGQKIKPVPKPEPPPADEKIVLKFTIDIKEYSLNGVKNPIDVAPVIKNGRTLLPARYVLEPLGGQVSWNDAEKKVICELGEITVELWIDKPTAKVNGVEIQIDPDNPEVVPTIIDGRTMVPMRFLAESLGCEVEWVAETMEIILTYKE